MFPDPCLREHARPVGEVTEEVRQVAQRMLEIMHAEEGIGLAAPQVGLAWRMFVCRLPADPHAEPAESGLPVDTEGEPMVCIDPELSLEGPISPFEEGCLSLPDIRGMVQRPPIVRLEATNLDGERFSVRGDGLLARCWQHEMDHLDGVLIIDKFAQLDRLRTRSALRRLEKRNA